MPLILGFAHKRRVGKDTAVKFALAHLAFNYPKLRVKRVSFADKLKSVAHQLYSWAGLREAGFYEDHPEEKEAPLQTMALGELTPRGIYIAIGQAMRAIHSETWVKSAFSGMAECDVMLITDVRFPNEAGYIRSLGGFVYKIVRPDAPLLDDPSETALDGYGGFAGMLKNYGTLKQFNEMVICIVERHLREQGY